MLVGRWKEASPGCFLVARRRRIVRHLAMRLSPKQKQCVVLTGLGLLVAAATASYLDFIHRKNTKNPEDFRRVRYLPPQPLFTTAPIKPVRKALKSLNPAEMVLGVIIGGKARAYPLNM